MPNRYEAGAHGYAGVAAAAPAGGAKDAKEQGT